MPFSDSSLQQSFIDIIQYIGIFIKMKKRNEFDLPKNVFGTKLLSLQDILYLSKLFLLKVNKTKNTHNTLYFLHY